MILFLVVYIALCIFGIICLLTFFVLEYSDLKKRNDYLELQLAKNEEKVAKLQKIIKNNLTIDQKSDKIIRKGGTGPAVKPEKRVQG